MFETISSKLYKKQYLDNTSTTCLKTEAEPRAESDEHIPDHDEHLYRTIKIVPCPSLQMLAGRSLGGYLRNLFSGDDCEKFDVVMHDLQIGINSALKLSEMKTHLPPATEYSLQENDHENCTSNHII